MLTQSENDCFLKASTYKGIECLLTAKENKPNIDIQN